MDSKKVENKLVRAITKAGLSWTVYSSIVEVVDNVYGIQLDPDAAPACWYYNKLTRQEKIAIHPEFVANNKTNDIVWIIKHEMLHKAMYRGLPNTKDQLLTNLCLDAAINKILCLANPKESVSVSSKIYKGEHRIGPLSICNCSIAREERDLIAKKIRDIFDEIYLTKDYGQGEKLASELVDSPRYINSDVPDPMNLYYKLSIVLNQNDKEEVKQSNPLLDQIDQQSNDGASGDNNDNSEDKSDDENNGKGSDEDESDDKEEQNNDNKQSGDEKEQNDKNKNGNQQSNEQKTPKPSELNIRGSNPNLRDNRKQTIQEEQDVCKDLQKNVSGKNWSAYKNLQETLGKYIFQSQDHETKDLKRFIESWQTMKQIEGVEHSIYADIAYQTRFDPIIENLSRTGLEYIALGVSGPDALPFYLNISDKTTCKKKVCCYLDISPSMKELIPYMVHFVEFFSSLDECELAGGEFAGKYTFAGSVHGLSDEQWEKFKKGDVSMGSSTSFQAVIEHSLDNINQDDTDIILVVTDGQSSLSNELIEKFNQTTRKCYRIYMDPGQNGSEITSNLDMLNGDSFSLDLRKHHEQ